MKFLKVICAALVVAASLSNTAFASGTGPGYISRIHVMPGGIILFTHSGTRDTPPSCGAGLPTRWAFNVNTAGGQAMHATLLTAYAAGKQIAIAGTSDCGNWGDTESVHYLYIVD